MNFADNGRHLADQDYNICMRQEEGMCSIAYEPCHENAFRINPNTESEGTGGDITVDSGSGDGGLGESRNMEICNDKIVLPCDSDDLILVSEMCTIFNGCLLNSSEKNFNCVIIFFVYL